MQREVSATALVSIVVIPLALCTMVACDDSSPVAALGTSQGGGAESSVSNAEGAAPQGLPAQYLSAAGLDSGLVLCLDNRGRYFRDAAGTQPCTDGDSCAYWEDLSGNGLHAKAVGGRAKPVYRASAFGGVQGLQWPFTGTPRLLSVGEPQVISDAFRRKFTTFVAVTKQDPTHDAAVVSKGDGGIFSLFSINIYQKKPCFRGVDVVPGYFSVAVSLDTLPGTTRGLLRYYQNGSARASQIPNSSWPFTVDSGNLVIGDIASGSWSTWDGMILTVLIYNRPLSPAEVWRLDHAVRQVYSEPWPGDASDKIVIWDGNSICAGGWIPQIAATDLGWPVECFINLSWGGKSTSDQIRSIATEVVPLVSELPAGKKIVSVGWEITNDLMGVQPPVAYQHVVTYGQSMHALGLPHVVGTCLPRVGFAGFEPWRNLVNDSIRANYASFADAVADVASDPLMGLDGMNPNPNPYYGDGVHPTAEGEAILAPYFAQALRTISTTTGVLRH